MLGALLAAPAVSQTVALQFSLSNPGARSMGFGGAFVALADDATAAFANPAGLVQLVEPEVSLEARSWSYSTPYARRGRVAGEPTGRGLDVEPGVAGGRSEEDLAGLSFLSLVYPRKRWTFAFYRHQLADFEYGAEIRGIFGLDDGADLRWPDTVGATRLELVTHAVAAAYRLSERLSLGLGLSHVGGEMLWREQQYLPEGDIYGPIPQVPERLSLDAALAVDDRAWGLTGGLLWRFAERWSAGAFFRLVPELDGDFMLETGPANPFSAPGDVTAGPVSIAFPDTYGLGVAFRSRGGRWTVSCELDGVRYSEFTDSLDQGLQRLGLGLVNGLDDRAELRLGAEYVFLEATPTVALRLGAWRDQAHQLFITATQAQVGGNRLHLAAGLGVVFERFQIDLAADLSDFVDTAAVSAIYSF